MKKRKGFTIIELIIVIAMLGILAVIYLPRFAGATDEARKSADLSSAAAIANACEMYYVLYNEKPSPKVLCEKNYIDKKILTPQYNSKTNLGYYVDISGGEATVYYSPTKTDDTSTLWGTDTADKVYPITK